MRALMLLVAAASLVNAIPTASAGPLLCVYGVGYAGQDCEVSVNAFGAARAQSVAVGGLGGGHTCTQRGATGAGTAAISLQGSAGYCADTYNYAAAEPLLAIAILHSRACGEVAIAADASCRWGHRAEYAIGVDNACGRTLAVDVTFGASSCPYGDGNHAYILIPIVLP